MPDDKPEEKPDDKPKSGGLDTVIRKALVEHDADKAKQAKEPPTKAKPEADAKPKDEPPTKAPNPFDWEMPGGGE